MDILVTTPKSEHETAKQEGEAVENGEGFWFRSFKKRVNVKVGDRVYYVDNGVITGYGVVFDIETGDMVDDAHEGKVWKGTHLKQREWHWLKTPIPFKGFQGFRYIDRIEGLREKLISAE